MAHWTPRRTSAPLAQLDAIEAAPPGVAPPPAPEPRRRLPEDSGGGGYENTNDGWSGLTPGEQAQFYAGNPAMAGITQTLQGLWGQTALGKLQNYMDPDFVRDQGDIAQGIDPRDAAARNSGNDALSGFLTLNDNFGTSAPSNVGPEVGESVSGNYDSGAYTSPVSPGNAVGADLGPLGPEVGESVSGSYDSYGGGGWDSGGYGDSGYGGSSSGESGGYGGGDGMDGGWARGGAVTADRLGGPNPRGPDDGYGALDVGEYVMRSSAVQRYGQEAMQALNEGRASITMNEGDPSADVQQLARMGRRGDTELVHMTKNEVAGMQDVAEQYGGSLTRNPETGLPEAFILEALGIGASLYSAYKGRKQAKQLGEQAQAADTWGQSGGRAMAGQQLQQLMQDPGQASANDPGYRMRIQGAQRAMASQGQDSGAMAVAAAGASSDWYNQRLEQLGRLAGAPGQPGIALQGQEAASDLYGRSLGSLGFGIQQAGSFFGNPGAGGQPTTATPPYQPQPSTQGWWSQRFGGY